MFDFASLAYTIFDIQKMQSRTRKLPRCDTDLDALTRQLNNDFEVHTYLQQHQLDLNNTDSYAQLLNSLILSRRTRTKHLLRLKTNHQPQPPIDISTRYLEFEAIEERTGKEWEVRNNLEREITETKKSLNLLKGDIGHLVSRNQSAQLLGSKVGKAKIVAEDQLKRVTLALAKDREEIKIRNQMQKKFSKKLKNVEAYESTGLVRVQKNYAEAQLRRKQVYQKLLSSQQTAQNGQQMAVLLTVKQKLDQNNRIQQVNLLQLAAVSRKFSLKHSQLPSNVPSLIQQIQSFVNFLELPTQPQEEEVKAAVEEVLCQYHHLKDSIKTMTEFYNEQLKTREELGAKMRQCDQEQRELLTKFQVQAFQCYRIRQQQYRSYNDQLKRFASIIKTHFVILSYLQRYFTLPQAGHEPRRNSRFTSEHNQAYCGYITQLHKTHQMLSTEQEWFDSALLAACPQQAELFYSSMLRDVKEWLDMLRVRYGKEGHHHAIVRSPYPKATAYSRTSQFAIPMDVLSTTPLSSQKHLPPSHPQEQPQEGVAQRAKRIKLLEDVDIDYYKMIKATMRMEKENTRKNYQFLRTFKRAKYASRDDILEEKRFEASFSVLFTKTPSPLTRTLNLNAYQPQPLSKTLHSSTQSTLKENIFKKSTFKSKEKVMVSAIPKSKAARRSMVESHQRRSRLTDKLRVALGYS